MRKRMSLDIFLGQKRLMVRDMMDVIFHVVMLENEPYLLDPLLPFLFMFALGLYQFFSFIVLGGLV